MNNVTYDNVTDDNLIDDNVINDNVIDDNLISYNRYYRNNNYRNNNTILDSEYDDYIDNEERPLIEEDNTFLDKNLKNYWKFLFIIAAYYILPSLQFVFFQAHDSNVNCYYNEKCKHDIDGIPAFNNIISNFGYILFGIVFIIIIRYNIDNNNSDYGIYTDKSLYYSLGIVLTLEGIFSGIYHICPSKLNFQFDTTFMFIGSSLMIITLYSKRHNSDNLPTAYFTYCFLSLVVLLNILPLSGISDGDEVWFWVLIYIFVFYLMIVLSVNIYYGKDWKNKNICKNLKSMKEFIKDLRPHDVPKFSILLISNIMSMIFLIFGSVYKVDFSEWILGLFIGNLITYFFYYIINKIGNRETISKKLWLLIFIDFIVLTISLTYYEMAVTNKMLTPSESKKLNEPCILFNYFDYHDLWHLFSSIGIFLAMYIIYILDDDLKNTLTVHIKVF